MSLREKFREGLFNYKNKPRLNYARNYFLDFNVDEDPDFKELTKFYNGWRDFSEYLLIQKQSDSLRLKGEINRETLAVKCSKRGNDVYWHRMRKRLRLLYGLDETTLFDSCGNDKKSSVLFVTLTYNVKRSSVRDAWEMVGADYNKWITSLRKRFGRVSDLRCWEASRKGYPHIHVLMIFHEHEFKIKRIKDKFRVSEKELFEKSYHSFVDVQAVREIRKGIRYITKYLTKTMNESQTQNLTLALCWLFKKRSFAVSGDFSKAIYNVMHSRQLVQMDLFGNAVAISVKWVLIGVYSADLLRVNPSLWSCHVDLNDFWVDWSENDRFATLVRKESQKMNNQNILSRAGLSLN